MSDSFPDSILQAGEQPDALLTELYERLRRMATRQMMRESEPQTLQATALVHEAWLRLSTSGETWPDRAYFCAAAAQTMRRILIENARRKSRVRRGGDQERVDLQMELIAEQMPEEGVLLIEEGLQELEKANPERARIVTLKFFGGLTNEDVARTLHIGTRSVEREWACAKAWLFRWMSGSR